MAKLNKTNTMKGRQSILSKSAGPTTMPSFKNNGDLNQCRIIIIKIITLNNNNDCDDDIELFLHSNSPLIYQISKATSHMME